MEEREYYLLTPRQKALAFSLPLGIVEGLLHSAREVLPLPSRKPLEVAFDLEGMGALLHPLSLLPDRLQDVLEMTGRAQWASRGVCGMEAGGRLLVGEGLAWIEVQVWRGESLETLSHELEEEANDRRCPDTLHREG